MALGVAALDLNAKVKALNLAAWAGGRGAALGGLTQSCCVCFLCGSVSNGGSPAKPAAHLHFDR